MFPVPLAKLRQFNSFFSRFSVLGGCVILPFTFSTNQRNYFSHFISPNKKNTNSPAPRFHRGKIGRFVTLPASEEGLARYPKRHNNLIILLQTGKLVNKVFTRF